ncbi:hypothetical protein EVAR_74445_1 [Eumeta japonica]|uniref:Uncharacterized protein n=1 Tax=Eumeta variegata TaxID=151549 RepID=A0A4C1YJM6_EUMVA|nr:hypothetical protein EVAR_74445_1 [Eumeta japonica]
MSSRRSVCPSIDKSVSVQSHGFGFEHLFGDNFATSVQKAESTALPDHIKILSSTVLFMAGEGEELPYDGRYNTSFIFCIFERQTVLRFTREYVVTVVHALSCVAIPVYQCVVSVLGFWVSFDHHSHDWEAFKVRLTQFCVANGVTDENDKISGVGALLITALTEDTMRGVKSGST